MPTFLWLSNISIFQVFKSFDHTTKKNIYLEKHLKKLDVILEVYGQKILCYLHSNRLFLFFFIENIKSLIFFCVFGC